MPVLCRLAFLCHGLWAPHFTPCRIGVGISFVTPLRVIRSAVTISFRVERRVLPNSCFLWTGSGRHRPMSLSGDDFRTVIDRNQHVSVDTCHITNRRGWLGKYVIGRIYEGRSISCDDNTTRGRVRTATAAVVFHGCLFDATGAEGEKEAQK